MQHFQDKVTGFYQTQSSSELRDKIKWKKRYISENSEFRHLN